MVDILPSRSPEPRLLDIWQAAMGDRQPIMPELWAANTAGDPSFRPGDLLVAVEAGEPVGFALTKRFREPTPTCERFRDIGYLALLAVAPAHQRRGIGTALLATAEAALSREGVMRVVLGGSFHHFLPGIPADTAEAFFTARGYALGERVWDVHANLSDAVLPDVSAAIAAAGVSIRLVAPEERGALLAFLETEFSGRWRYDADFYTAEPDRASRVAGVFEGDRLLGFALLHPPRARGALRWAGFSKDVAALGPIGLAASTRGQGLGLALLVRGLELLRTLGAQDTVIDWTTLLDFYARAGFAPWLAYRLGAKDL
ncbi:MAG TPA: GNAT family N-acetyltransferase [Oscillatoriaceae cyanobacterium]